MVGWTPRKIGWMSCSKSFADSRKPRISIHPPYDPPPDAPLRRSATRVFMRWMLPVRVRAGRCRSFRETISVNGDEALKKGAVAVWRNGGLDSDKDRMDVLLDKLCRFAKASDIDPPTLRPTLEFLSAIQYFFAHLRLHVSDQASPKSKPSPESSIIRVTTSSMKTYNQTIKFGKNKPLG